MNRTSLLALVLVFAGTAAHAASIYSDDGTYLGNLSTNKYDPNSTSNPYGQYGSKYSPDSINNEYGRYGSKYSPDSVNNPYAVNAPTPKYTSPGAALSEGLTSGVSLGMGLAAPNSPTPAPDFSGLSTIGAPGSGLQFKTDAPPAVAVAPAVETPVDKALNKYLDSLDMEDYNAYKQARIDAGLPAIDPNARSCEGLNAVDCLEQMRREKKEAAK